MRDHLGLQLLTFSETIDLDQEAFAQVARTGANRIESLDQIERRLRHGVFDPGRLRDLDQRHFQKTGVVDIADDLLADANHVGIAGGKSQLPQQMVGEVGCLDLGIEKELAPLGRFGIVGRGGRIVLGELFAPFLVLLAQFRDLLVPILRIGLGLDLVGRFLRTGLISISCWTSDCNSIAGACRNCSDCCIWGDNVCPSERF